MNLTHDIIQLGNPILRKPSAPIDFPLPDQQISLIDHLLATMQKSAGVGIAAPQVGHLEQVIIVGSRPNLRYPTAPSMKPQVMINPNIIEASDCLIEDWEGCLSIPGIRGKVSRSDKITVQYWDVEGREHVDRFSGFIARIIQHECDHLIGKVFLDRVESTFDLMSEREFLKQEINTSKINF